MVIERVAKSLNGALRTWLVASVIVGLMLLALPSSATAIHSALHNTVFGDDGEEPPSHAGGDRANPTAVTTMTPARTLPTSNTPLVSGWTEGFDDIALLPGLGWAFINNSEPLGVTGWFQGNAIVFTAHTGITNSYIGANFNNTSDVGAISNWLLTPEITMNNGDTITFYTRRTVSEWQDRLQVRLSTHGSSTDVGVTATSVGDFDTLLLDINPTYESGGYPQVWTQFGITLTGLSAATNGRLAFRYFVEDGGPDGSNSDYIGIDTLEYIAASQTTPHFAYINQPWDWIDGVTDPEAAINATLNRGGSAIATASTTSGANGRFSFNFLSSGNHLDLLVGDEVVVTGGDLDVTLTLIDISGGIDVAANHVTGQALGGVFPTSGVASVGWPSALGFTAQVFQFANDGSFVVDFEGVTDIDADYLAKVDYTDPNGNMVVQLFNPEGLDIRVLISEGRVEGVTTPGETVSVLVSDANGPKASATVTADMTGFYTTLVYDRDHKVSLNLGDHIEVKNSKRIRSTTLTMFHVSYLQPWSNRVIGNILGVNYPPEGGTGRVDLWSVSEQKWYTQYIGIGPYGVYEANFDGIVDMMDADIVRVWATFPDGSQQAALGWGLHLGVSPSDDEVWGYTAAESTVDVRLYRGLVDGQPVDLIGTVTTTTHSSGYFSTTVMSDGQPVDIAPSNVVMVQTANYMQSLFVGKISATADVDENRLTISGLPNSILHIEGRRKGVKREDAPFQDDYIWREVSLDATGTAVVDLSAFDLQPDDVFDLTCYIEEQGLAIHTAAAVPGEVIGLVYLPLVVRDPN